MSAPVARTLSGSIALTVAGGADRHERGRADLAARRREHPGRAPVPSRRVDPEPDPARHLVPPRSTPGPPTGPPGRFSYIFAQEFARADGMNIETEPVEGTPLIAPSTTDHPLYDQVVEACRTVYDPEIPVNIFDLGLVYTIEISDEGDVRIAMTLTAPGCPVAGDMPGWVADAVEPLPGVRQVDVELVWEPQWGMDMMSDEARLELGFM